MFIQAGRMEIRIRTEYMYTCDYRASGIHFHTLRIGRTIGSCKVPGRVLRRRFDPSLADTSQVKSSQVNYQCFAFHSGFFPDSYSLRTPVAPFRDLTEPTTLGMPA